MEGLEPITSSNEGTTNQNTTRDIIEGHLSALKELLKEPNNQNLTSNPPCLSRFSMISWTCSRNAPFTSAGSVEVFCLRYRDCGKRAKDMMIGSGEDYKEYIRQNIMDGLVSREIKEEWPMPVWCRIVPHKNPSMQAKVVNAYFMFYERSTKCSGVGQTLLMTDIPQDSRRKCWKRCGDYLRSKEWKHCSMNCVRGEISSEEDSSPVPRGYTA
ncbi:hypothetical protein Tco_1145941 [Tanacetum coccineum]